jgi:hypothetical protein
MFTALGFTTFLLGCAGPAPEPEPGMELVQYGRGEEMQVAAGVDWNRYTKVVLHAAPVEFRDHWKREQERVLGKTIRDEDVQRIKTTVAGFFSKAMHKALTEQGRYELTSESGPGVMVFMPNIVDLDVEAVGWVQNNIVESIPKTRGRMTIELVVRDSVSDKLLAVAWQQTSDPREGDMEMTTSVNNSVAFRLMSKNFAHWVLKPLD